MHQNDTLAHPSEGQAFKLCFQYQDRSWVGVICFQSDMLATKGMTIVFSIGIIYRERTRICVHLDLLATALKSEDMASGGIEEDWLVGDQLGLLGQETSV